MGACLPYDTQDNTPHPLGRIPKLIFSAMSRVDTTRRATRLWTEPDEVFPKPPFSLDSPSKACPLKARPLRQLFENIGSEIHIACFLYGIRYARVSSGKTSYRLVVMGKKKKLYCIRTDVLRGGNRMETALFLVQMCWRDCILRSMGDNNTTSSIFFCLFF